MLRDLDVFTWKLLRTAARSDVPLTGRQLRVVPTRWSKSGEFLDELVADGLIEVVAVLPDPAPRGASKKPAQFRTTYKLTAKGLHAAEYGEYDKPTTYDARFAEWKAGGVAVVAKTSNKTAKKIKKK